MRPGWAGQRYLAAISPLGVHHREKKKKKAGCSWFGLVLVLSHLFVHETVVVQPARLNNGIGGLLEAA